MGRVEGITLAHVIVRTWDERRLILPCLYFLEHPFQNWTRNSAHLLAAVHVAVDFTTPVERVREELRSILDGSELWDRRSWNLQVTDIGTDSVELRALARFELFGVGTNRPGVLLEAARGAD